MRKLIVFIIVGAALAYGGIKLYFWHRIGSAADRLIQVARPFAAISYEGTIATLAGRAGLEGIEIRPMGYDTAITIDELTLEAENLLALYNIGSTLEEGRLPTELAVQLRGVEFDPTADPFREVLASPGLWGMLNMPYDALACGDRGRFSPLDLMQMGVREVKSDIELGYVLDPAQQVMHVDLLSHTPGFNNTDLRISFAVDSTEPEARQLFQSRPPLAGGSLRYEDTGWHERFRAFCAGETGLTQDAFVAEHADAVWRALAGDGIDAGPKLHTAYQEFLRDSGRLTLDITPMQNVKLETLRFYAPEDILFYLRPELKINGETIAMDQVKANKDFSRQELAEYSHDSKPAAQTAPENLMPISVRQLARHVNRFVRLTTDSGRTFEGKLLKVDDRIARINTQTYNGTREEIVLLMAVEAAFVADPGKKAE